MTDVAADTSTNYSTSISFIFISQSLDNLRQNQFIVIRVDRDIVLNYIYLT